MWSYIFFFFLFLLLAFLTSAYDLAVLGCAIVGGGWVLFSELKLGTGVSKRSGSQLVLFWSCNKVFLWRSAFFVGSLCGELAVDVASSGRLWASLFVLIFLLCLLNIFVSFDTAQDFIRLPLCPDKVIVLPVIIVTHWPPEPRLKSCSYNAWIVASTDVVFIRCKRSIWELYFLDSIWFQNFDQELSIIFLF